MQPADLNVIKEIPGYKVILKTVLKTQIQQLVEQLADHTGEESVILTASVSDGTLSHLGSDSGKVFLEDHDDIKTQFLGFCLKRHHKQKQLEKEKQQQQESLMESANRLLSMPTTPTRYGTGMRPRFTPTRVPPSPRQQFSPRFQTSPRQSFSSPNQGRIQSSPRLQPVPLTGVSPQGTQRVGQSNVRHEPYPATRPRRPALNFNQQGRNPNLNQKKPTSTMKLPTEPQNVKKINIDPNEVIKIEAADEDEEIQIKTKPPERQLSCETGIKIASVSGATEISTASTAGSAVTTDTNKSSISQASVVEPSISRAPSVSSAPSPSHSSQPVSPTTMPVLSPIPKEENSSSSASTIVNDSSDTKISDNAPLEGLSLGSDLSKLTGIPTKTPKTEGLESSSAASTSTVSQDSSSGNGQSVKVKVEATGESEMELQITGIEPGQMTHGQSNQVPDLQNRMGFGPSTSGMSDVGDVMGAQMNPEYKNSTTGSKAQSNGSAPDLKSKVTSGTKASVGSSPSTSAACNTSVAVSKTSTKSTSIPPSPSGGLKTSIDEFKAHEKDAINSWSKPKEVVSSKSDDNDDVIIVSDSAKTDEPVNKRRKVQRVSAGNNNNTALEQQKNYVQQAQDKQIVQTNSEKLPKKIDVDDKDDIVLIDVVNESSTTPKASQNNISSVSKSPVTSTSIRTPVVGVGVPNANKSKKVSPELIIDVDEVDGASKTSVRNIVPAPSDSSPVLSTPHKRHDVAQNMMPPASPQLNSRGQGALYFNSPQQRVVSNPLSPPVSPQPKHTVTGTTQILPQQAFVTQAQSPPISPQEKPGLQGLIPPMSPQQPKFYCGDCGKACPSHSALEQHHRTHTGVKPFECDVCGKKFSAKHSVKNHVRTHFKEKK